MKKILSLSAFFLISSSAFASGHGADVVGSALLFLAGTVFCVMGFVVLTVLSIINSSRPGKSRTMVCTILLSFFTIIFLYLLYESAQGTLTDTGRGLLIFISLFFIGLITLNIIFLVKAFSKLNNNTKKW